jgi:hypothetical protein
LGWPNPEVPFFRNGDLRDVALTSIFVFVGRSCAVIGLGLEGIFMLVRVPRAVAMAAFIFSGCCRTRHSRQESNRTFDGCAVNSSALFN